jgi:hypothetical protein
MNRLEPLNAAEVLPMRPYCPGRRVQPLQPLPEAPLEPRQGV